MAPFAFIAIHSNACLACCQLKSYDNSRVAPCIIDTRGNIYFSAKNSTHQDTGAKAPVENISKYVDVRSAVTSRLSGYLNSPVLSVEVGRKMWQNTKNCVGIVGVLLNNTTVRCIQTSVVQNAAGSSAAQLGYASEDKILQIRQHRNDFTQQFPSVTLILNKTMTEESRTALEKWKQDRIAEMGPEEFERFYQGL